MVNNLPEPLITTLLKGKVGSHAYGTAVETSDDDFMAVVLPSEEHYIGLKEWGHRGTKEYKLFNGDPVDMVCYELKKFFNLCLSFNPNVIPLVYLKEYEIVSPGGKLILNNRDMFLSQRAYHTFIGYTRAQISEIHRGLTGKYGEKRKLLIQKYGYDVKFAYHTVRLLEMIDEFLETGIMNVYRGNRIQILMEIRSGEWSEDKFFNYVDKLMQKVENKFMVGTWLPDVPDYEKANDVCMQIIKMGV